MFLADARTTPARDESIEGKRAPLTHAVGASRVAGAEIGNDGLARDRRLALGNERPDTFGQVAVDARAKADEADPLTGADDIALAYERHDAARDEAGDLHHADTRAAAGDDQRITLVVLARLVEVGVDEFSRRV